MRPEPITDSMERLIADALDDAGIAYRRDHVSRLDFYLCDLDVHIEVKRMHSPRIANQTARVNNVIVAQGLEAVRALVCMIRSSNHHA